jgi:hypothetical protein
MHCLLRTVVAMAAFLGLLLSGASGLQEADAQVWKPRTKAKAEAAPAKKSKSKATAKKRAPAPAKAKKPDRTETGATPVDLVPDDEDDAPAGLTAREVERSAPKATKAARDAKVESEDDKPSRSAKKAANTEPVPDDSEVILVIDEG